MVNALGVHENLACVLHCGAGRARKGPIDATHDCRSEVRLLLTKRPWFTLLTVLVLSGGLGVSVYTFAALNAMIYRDLPLPDGSSIVRVGGGDWVGFCRSMPSSSRRLGGG